jgi:hypothetical protein
MLVDFKIREKKIIMARYFIHDGLRLIKHWNNNGIFSNITVILKCLQKNSYRNSLKVHRSLCKENI